MKILFRLNVLALILSLTACQHVAPDQSLAPEDSAISPTTSSAVMATQTQPVSQPQSTPVIQLYLAQELDEPALVTIDIGGVVLHALPQPVLTEDDVRSVAPAATQDERTFLLLDMNKKGTARLHNITKQAQGHYLLLSVRGQLVAVNQISTTITDGRLLIGTQNSESSLAILKLIKNGH